MKNIKLQLQPKLTDREAKPWLLTKISTQPLIRTPNIQVKPFLFAWLVLPIWSSIFTGALFTSHFARTSIAKITTISTNIGWLHNGEGRMDTIPLFQKLVYLHTKADKALIGSQRHKKTFNLFASRIFHQQLQKYLFIFYF